MIYVIICNSLVTQQCSRLIFKLMLHIIIIIIIIHKIVSWLTLYLLQTAQVDSTSFLAVYTFSHKFITF